ncbi:SulP family sulfate permease [Modicisalibacter xianhensis]|uniref:SulP family sulfate permease n=1 Tax=Modicisalibacter xianhensis TaxID=442341 RepID=A0A4R8FW42_9GAMM|nr:SulP family inorganic anion transporter [Halomonas xianhensis]TDX29787.1 SulP family sulfate permease [Halomonas xianhensis]
MTPLLANTSHLPPGKLQRWFPFLSWLPRHSLGSLRADAIAGLTGAVLVVPQGVAYALLAGLPPAYGLYTAIVPAILAALFGSSKYMVSGPTAALSIAVFATLSPLAAPGSSEYISLMLTLTFLVGAFQCLLGMARLGILVDLVSHSVVIGFTAGAALIIAASQLPYILGLGQIGQHGFLGLWPVLIERWDDIQLSAIMIAGLTLATCLAFQRWLPRWPGMLIAIVLASLVTAWIDPQQHTIARIGIVQAGLPPLTAPDISQDSLILMTPSAIALGLLGLVEAAAISRTFALRSQERVDNNQEFFGQGLSNIGGAFFSSYVSSGSFTRSGLNASAGAQSPLAALLAAAFLVPILLLAAPMLHDIPMPAMAGLLLLVAAKLIDRDGVRQVLSSSRPETAILLITFFGTLLLSLEFSIYMGVLASLAFYLHRTTHPPVVQCPLSQAPSQLETLLKEKDHHVIRIDGSLFFGSCNAVARELDDLESPDLVILASGINFIDFSGIQLLHNQAKARHIRGGKLHLAWPKPDVIACLANAGIIDNDNVASHEKSMVITI